MNLVWLLAWKNECSEPRVLQTLECYVGEFLVCKYTVAHAAQPNRFRQQTIVQVVRCPANRRMEILFGHPKSGQAPDALLRL